MINSDSQEIYWLAASTVTIQRIIQIDTESCSLKYIKLR